jgi:hypothetical protein
MTDATFAELAGVLDTAALEGSWQNTNTASRWIPRIDIAPHPFGLTIRAWDLSVAAHVFTDAIDSKEGMAFSAVFDLGYADVHMQANIKGGVLVVATFIRIKDDSGRSSYFTREFYWRQSS